MLEAMTFPPKNKIAQYSQPVNIYLLFGGHFLGNRGLFPLGKKSGGNTTYFDANHRSLF